MQPSAQFQSALGWFDLGNYVEAFNELENLPPEHRASVEVMELRCEIYRKLEKWQELENVASGSFEPKQSLNDTETIEGKKAQNLLQSRMRCSLAAKTRNCKMASKSV